MAVESLPADGPAAFKYRGKGVLFSTTNGEDNNKTPYLGDIEPEDNAADWMTFQFWVQRAAKPDGGDCQVKLNSNKVEMSIYAQEGVTTEQESAIFGNLITQTINKHKIPDEATLQVFYNVKRLAPSASGGPQEAEWGDGTWTRVSVSPRISGYYDRYR
ncbi:MAG: hypothetical protein HUU06_02675 [Planctomycetaceae bacterium]|nr:hypothetical protein [Planctomycetaceae bacterium]